LDLKIGVDTKYFVGISSKAGKILAWTGTPSTASGNKQVGGIM
jgi:hypothetical protein